MYPRVEYEMTDKDLKSILEACRPVPCISIGGFSPRSPQSNANDAWRALGNKMGFDYQTVRPIPGKGQKFFSAVPMENDVQKSERLAREAKDRRTAEIKKLEAEIADCQNKLAKLSQ